MSGKNLLERLDESKALHYLVDSLGGRSAVNRLLHYLPVPRRAPGGARYRVRFLDTLPLANEIFVQRIYDQAMTLGCAPSWTSGPMSGCSSRGSPS